MGMTLDELIVKVRVAADGADEELDGVLDDLKKFAADAKKAAADAASSEATKRGAAEKAAAWAAMSAAAGNAFGKICGAIQTGLDKSNEYAAAVKGLQSVAEANDIGSTRLQQALDSITDEFFNAASAATAFKNLLSRGYTLEQATQTIDRLKNSAAYGRQANLTLSDAVVSATEGIRNENSILVDNAGVTKNVAKMWEEYAKERGVATTSLTQAQKVEAEYLGILQETSAQVGDLDKLSEGLAGSQAKAANQTQLLAQSFGEAMTPVAGLGTDLFTGLLEGLKGAADAVPELTAGLTTATTAMTGLVAAAAGLKTVKTLLSSIKLTSASLGPLAAIAAVLGTIAGLYTAVKNAQEEAAKAEEARIQANREAVSDQAERLERLNTLTSRYNELSGKESLSYSEQREMVSIKRELAEVYGVVAENANAAADAQRNYNAALNEATKKELQELYDRQAQVVQDARNKATGDDVVKQAEAYAKAVTELAWSQEQLNDAVSKGEPEGSEIYNMLVGWVEDDTAALKTAKTDLNEYSDLYADWFDKAVDLALTEAQLRGDEVSDSMADVLRDMFSLNLASFGGDMEKASAYVERMVALLTAACSGADVSQAVEAAKGVMDNVLAGAAPSDEDVQTFQDAWDTIFDPEGTVMPWLEQISAATGETLPVLQESIMESLTGFTGFADGVAESGQEVTDTLNAIAQEALESGDALAVLDEAFDWSGASAQDATARAKQLLNTYRDLSSRVNELDSRMDRLKTGQTALTAAQKKGVTTISGADDAVKALAKDAGYSGDSLDELSTYLTGYAQHLQSEMESTQGSLVSLNDELVNAQDCANVDGEVNVQVAGALTALQAVMDKASALLALLQALGIAGTGGTSRSGGGGGSGKDDAEEAAREAERLRKEAIQKDYDLIDHRRHLNEISYEEELEMLEKLRKKHQLNAEEIMEWEEKVYDLKQKIRERDAGNVDTLAEGIITALENRYQAMLEAEVERLDASRKAWEDWRDDSVQAIEDQIDALDQLADTEDREKQDQEELRKIAKLRQQIEFEQDDYNRAKLEQQLEQAIDSREERLRKLEIQDQKAALQEQIKQIEAEAEKQLDALDEEQEAIEKSYEERMQTASLQAEAEKLLLTQSQDQILALLNDYAPEYNATGETLGEKLLEGFQSKVGNIEKWFEQFNEQIQNAQAQTAAIAQAAADSFYQQQAERESAQSASGVPSVVQQTVYFNQPVETPSQVARRMEQVNEELALLL